MVPLRAILVPTDFSEYSAHAFRLACALAHDYEARLIVLHVKPQPAIAFFDTALPPAGEETDEQLHTRLLQVAPRDPKLLMEHLLVQGDAVTEIIRAASENQCDLIFMGTHGRTGLGRAVLGSVTEQVLRKAPCPVLTVKLPMPQEAPGTKTTTKKAAQPVGAR